MIVRIAVRVGAGHDLPACRTPAELAEALRNLADEIAAAGALDRLAWPRIVKNADGGWAGHARLVTEGAGPEGAP